MDMILTADDPSFRDYIEEPHDKDKVVGPHGFRDATIDYLTGADKLVGSTMPWRKTHDHIRFRPGEVSLWMGINGHGKSLVTSQIALDFLHQGDRVCIASFEMKPRATIARMVRQGFGTHQPSAIAVDAFITHASGKLWLYDKMGQTDPKHLLAIMRYARRKLGINHFFVDSIMKVVKGEDDYNGQKEFVNIICDFAQDTDCHVHLIHHSRKLGDENDVPGKMDAKGSGAIVDQIDQSFTVWRNKRKEQDRQKGKEIDETIPDALIVCDKNRHGEWEGRIGLYYLPGVASYCEQPGRAITYHRAYERYMRDESAPI